MAGTTKSKFTSTNLFGAIVNGDEAMVHEILSENNHLIEEKNLLGKTPLHLAIVYGKSAIAQFLFNLTPDINSSDIDSNTPLHSACMRDDYPLASALVYKGADCGARNSKGKTPLHYAFSSGDTDLCQLLLKKDLSNIFKLDSFGKSPVHYLSFYHNNGCKILLNTFMVPGKKLKNSLVYAIFGASHCAENHCKILYLFFKLELAGCTLFHGKIALTKALLSYCNTPIYQRYLAEINFLQNFSICSYPAKKSIFDLIFLKRKNALPYSNNTNVLRFQELYDENVSVFFPDFGWMLENTMKKLIKRRNLYLNSQFKLAEVGFFFMPDLIMSEILSYFNEQELMIIGSES